MRLRPVTPALAILACTTCVTGVELDPVNPVPVLQAVQPAMLSVGVTTRTIALTGRDFVSSSEGTWNGMPRPTEFVSASEIRVTLDPADVAAPGTGVLGVSTPAPGGGVASPRTYMIGNPLTTIDSLSPSSATTQGAPPFTLRVFGTGFTSYGSGSQIVFDGSALPTVLVSPTELRTTVPDYLVPIGGVVSVLVLNPPPGGGASAPATFTVSNPSPVVSGFSPDSVRLGEPAEIEIAGSGFVPGTIVWLGSSGFVPSSLSPTSIRLRVPSVASRDGTLRVQSPAPGGGYSNALVVGIQERQPVVASVLPTAVVVGRGDQEIRFAGFAFAPDAEVTWSGASLPTRYTTASEPGEYEPPDTLIATVPASLSATITAATLRVTNPRSGGSAPDIPTAALPEGRIALTNAFTTVSTDLNGADVAPIPLSTAGEIPYRAVLFDAWPTGQRIVATRGYAGFGREPGLFLAEPAVDPSQIFPDDVTSPRASPDGQWIYYTSDLWQTPDTIWRVGPEGSGRELVAVDYAWPEPSPAGDRVVLSSSATRDLVILDLGTGTFTPLGVQGLDSRWSPDGQWIAYRSPADNRLRLVRPDGSGDRPLGTDTRHRAGTFDWSPDGQYLLGVAFVYVEGPWSNWGRLELVDVGTGEIYRWRTPLVAPDGLQDLWGLSWYPDP